MAKEIPNASNTNYSKDRYNKKRNEACFLSNNEKIRYDSIIILEMFHREEFCDLFDGLDKLYLNFKDIGNRLNYRTILSNDEIKMFRRNMPMTLPPIINTNLKYKSRDVVYQDIDNDINCITITLKDSLPSIISLQIQASLDSSVSDKINNIIHTYHDEAKGKFSEYIIQEEINEIKNNLKNQVIKFLSVYFEGFFFKKANDDISYVPSIDLFSLNYPKESDDIREWLLKNHAFFYYFNISAISETTYKCEEYLFLIDNISNDGVFSNYSIIANLDNTHKNETDTIMESHQYGLNYYSFELFCFYRWLEICGKIGNDFSLLISNELKYISKNNIKNVILNREKISTYIYYFKIFRIEFNKYESMFTIYSSDFELLYEEKNYLFDLIIKHIHKRVDYMNEFLNLLNCHSDNTLTLKNIVYSKKVQTSVHILTILLLIIGLIQIKAFTFIYSIFNNYAIPFLYKLGGLQ